MTPASRAPDDLPTPAAKQSADDAVNLTHFDQHGRSRMVEVGDKAVTSRQARASAQVHMQPSTSELIRNRQLSKGDVLEVARLAGIMAAKRTSDLIPLCHPLPLSGVEVDIEFVDATTLQIESCVRVRGQTGVEMEALTAVSVAALTVYDMCKAVDRSMTIGQIQLEEKSGGKSGSYRRRAPDSPPRK